jgi:hypothetical protein
MSAVARIVRAVTAAIVGLIVVGILIHLAGANTSHGIVAALDDAAKWLVAPFRGTFSMHGAKANVLVNWGLAAVVYAIAGALILRALPRPSLLGRLRRPWRRRRRVPFA